MTSRKQPASAAYTKLDNGSTPPSSNWGRYVGIGVAVFIFFLLLSAGGGDNEKQDDNLRSGQAQRPTSPDPVKKSVPEQGAGHSAPVEKPPTKPATPSTTNRTFGTIESDTSKAIDESVNKALAELTKAKDDELKQDEGELTSTWKKVSGSIKSGLSKLFGGTVSTEEVDAVAQEVQKEVEKEQKAEISELREVAVDVVDDQTGEVEAVAEMDEEGGKDAKAIREDVSQVKAGATKEVKEEIKDKAEELEEKVEGKFAEIEKKVIKEKLEKKYGDKVKVKVSDNKVTLASESEGETPSGGEGEEGEAAPKKKKSSKKKKKKVSTDEEDDSSESSVKNIGDEAEKVEREDASGEDDEKPKKKKKKSVATTDSSEGGTEESEESTPKKKTSKKKKKKAVDEEEEEN